MYCRECGEEFANDKAVICVKCGTAKGQGNNYCPECGAEVKNKASEVCLNCGVSLKKGKNFSKGTNAIPTEMFSGGAGNSKPFGNSKTTAGVLAIVLAAIGVHKFYLGYMLFGIIQAAIFLIGLFLPVLWWINIIWSIVDAVRIFSGKMTTSTGEELV